MNYWRRNLRKTYDDWRWYSGLITFINALVVMGTWYAVNASMITSNEARWIAVPVALLSVLLFGVVFLCVTPRRLWQESQSRISQLEDALKPRLKLTLGSGGSFDQYWQNYDKPNGQEHLIRVALSNLGNTSIDNVAVLIAEIDPDVITFLPIELIRMNDVAPWASSRSFPVHPGPPVYLDLVLKHESVKSKFALQYASELPNQLPSDRAYKLCLVARGTNARSDPLYCWIDSDSTGHLVVKPVDP